MSELDNAIKRLKENADNKELPYMITDIIKKNCSQEVINLILQNLKEYDNANSSEAMKCLFRIGYNHRMDYINGKHKEDYNTIKNYILKAQENEKLLQVIKQEFKLELYDICKRRLELSTNANRDNLEKILEWLK